MTLALAVAAKNIKNAAAQINKKIFLFIKTSLIFKRGFLFLIYYPVVGNIIRFIH
jgi:hypothetical protein